MNDKLRLLEKFGYEPNVKIKNFTKLHTWRGKEVWESFIPFAVFYQISEFELYKLIKKNEHHAKDFIQTHYGI